MFDIVLHKLNESYIKIQCEKHFAQELHQYFSFRVPGYQFTPAYKNKLWNGFIYLFSLRDFTLYAGLVPYVEKFCSERNYTLKIDSELKLTENFSLTEAEQFIKSLNLPHEVRDYQLKAFVNAIRNKRMLLVSPTASGKSLIIYLIVKWLQSNDYKKGLLIVPTISLVHQIFKDFKSYGYDSELNCHMIHQGQEKNSDKFIYISTWQSIFKNDPDYFHQFDFVMGDESHLFKSKSLTTILTNCINSNYRIGCTGTLDGSVTNKLVLEGLFGPVYQNTTTFNLIEQNYLAEFNIKCLVLKYPEEVCKIAKSWDYQSEIDFIVKCDKRNIFIKNLALSLKGNTLILFNFVEKHGKHLHELIKNESIERQVFFVFGGTDVEIRESVREITEKENDAIIVASYGVFSQGINIRNLNNIIFASPSKSRIRNLQSIGRVLRKGDNKKQATLFDISDDFRVGKFTNFTLNHMIERLKIYESERFSYKIYNIEINI